MNTIDNMIKNTTNNVSRASMTSNKAGTIVLLMALALGLMLPLEADTAHPHPSILHATFINQNASYPESHASTIVEVSPGHLVSAWFGGTKEKNPDVCIWVSHFENGKWTNAVNVANGIQEGGKRFPTWNPVLFQPPQPGAPLILFYKAGPSAASWWGMMITSKDGGRTWSKPVRLPEGVYGPVKNKPVVLSDGTWLSASSTEHGKEGWRVHFEYSQDQGKTWTVVKPGKGAVSFDAIQPSVLFHKADNPNGGLQALCRTKQGVVAMTWSKDNGKTWSAPVATELPNPNSGTDALTLSDGRQLIVYNPTAHNPGSPGKGSRYPLSVALSNDGLSWNRILDLDTEPCRSGYSYPAVIQTSDGLVHVTYTYNRKCIKHVVIDPKKL